MGNYPHPDPFHPMKTKVCKTCNQTKPETDFYKHVKHGEGTRANCKACSRSKKLEKLYGITQEGYNELFIKQNGRCAICGTTDTGRHNYFDVDHCHETGKVRGLLCNRCNRALGRFEAIGIDKLQHYLNDSFDTDTK